MDCGDRASGQSGLGCNSRSVNASSLWKQLANWCAGQVFRLDQPHPGPVQSDPSVPLDGDRVLKSLVWKANGSQDKAIAIASFTGSILGFMFIGAGILIAFSTGNFFGAYGSYLSVSSPNPLHLLGDETKPSTTLCLVGGLLIPRNRLCQGWNQAPRPRAC